MAAAPKRRRSVQEPRSIACELPSGQAIARSLARHLHRGVGNAFILYANYKHYQRQTHRPHCGDLHRVFGEFALEMLGGVDDLAKRIHTISQGPPAHLLEAIDLAAVSTAAQGSTVRGMVEEADRNLLIMLKQLRDAAAIANAYDDRGTFDVTSSLVQVSERHNLWFRDILDTLHDWQRPPRS